MQSIESSVATLRDYRFDLDEPVEEVYLSFFRIWIWLRQCIDTWDQEELSRLSRPLTLALREYHYELEKEILPPNLAAMDFLLTDFFLMVKASHQEYSQLLSGYDNDALEAWDAVVWTPT